jgi:hydroxymethylglutaryl-CoA reductase (NADPH)
VTAERNLTGKIINQILRTTSEKLYQCFHPSKRLALLMECWAIMLMWQTQLQQFMWLLARLSCIHESSIGFLHLEKTEGLKLQLNLTNLVIGT